MRGLPFSRGLLLVSLSLLAACEEQPRAADKPKTEIFVSGGVLQVAGNDPILSTPAKSTAPILLPQEGDPSLDWSDPCASNLQALTGQLLFYYSLHKELPPTLADIPAMPGETRALLACPKTGKPYSYVPEGIRSPSDLLTIDRKTGMAREGNLLILYDSVPAHELTQRLSDGKKEWTEKQTVRLGIVMEPPTPQTKAIKMYVVPIQQALLDRYLRKPVQ